MITRDEILATGLPLDDHGALAEALSVGRTKVVTSPIGIGTVLAAMAPSGGDFLNALESMGAIDSNVKWALKMIEQGMFDVGHPVTRAQLQAFAFAAPTMVAGIDALLNVALVPDVVTEHDIRCAIYDPLTGELING
jgi:hypothetical protein